MRQIIGAYRHIPQPIVLLIAAEFFIQLTNAAFFLLLNFYLVREGFLDYKIADFVSYRFLTVVIFALPIGFFIKGRRLMPLFLFASFTVPLMGLLIVYAIDARIEALVYAGMMLWGLAFACMQIPILPFVLRNAPPEHHSEAIALIHVTWSASAFLSGALIFGLSKVMPDLFTERTLLIFFSVIGFLALLFLFRMLGKEKSVSPLSDQPDSRLNNWTLIAKTLVPTWLIAVGAGLTIQFINLFFFHVFGVDYDIFSLVSALTTVLVVLMIIVVPTIKRRFGYSMAITVSQSLAILALICLACTEFFNHLPFVVYIAFFCYIIRQPLMNMAAPMTSELTMYYVGKPNQEMVSSLTAAIWSGSWFFSAQLFRIMRAHDVPYAYILFITAALYTTGVLWYHFLIRDYSKRKALGLLETEQS